LNRICTVAQSYPFGTLGHGSPIYKLDIYEGYSLQVSVFYSFLICMGYPHRVSLQWRP